MTINENETVVYHIASWKCFHSCFETLVQINVVIATGEYVSFAMIESRYRWPCHSHPELLPQLRDFPIQVFDAEQTSRATADHAP